MAIVTRAIGLEGEDVIEFRYQLTRATFGAAKLPPEEAAASRAIVDKTLRDLIAENVRQPGDNLIAGLIAAEIVDEDTGEKRSLTEDEIRSEEHTSELQSLIRISYAVFCLKKTRHI